MNNWIVVTFHFIGFVTLDLNINQIMKDSFRLLSYDQFGDKFVLLFVLYICLLAFLS